MTLLHQHTLLGELPAQAARTIEAGDGLTLRVLQGRLWVTQTGQHQDHFPQAGDELWLQGPTVVLQADAGAEPVRYALEVQSPNSTGKARTPAKSRSWVTNAAAPMSSAEAS